MQRTTQKKVGRPSLFWLFTETGRAVTELGINYPYQWFYTPKEQGDGHPVLVLPGFLASAQSTTVLRKFIDKIGYTSYDWDIGRNYGKVEYLDRLLEQVDRLHEAHGQAVSLIGWSLGGVYARQIGKERPGIIRQIITMGSPFQAVRAANHATWIHKLINLGKSDQRPDDDEFIASIPYPAPVPTTAIYSKEDGIVPWRACMEVEDELHQNVRVRSSHLGFGVNPAVYTIIVDRLQRTRHNWEPFQAPSKMKDRFFYPVT